MTHANAPLTPTGRQRLVDTVLIDGWSYRRTAERFNVSVATVSRWVARARAGESLNDRSSRPYDQSRRTPRRIERKILRTRVKRNWGPQRIAWHLGLNPSTVHRVLVRYHAPKLSEIDQMTGTRIRRPDPQRYQYDLPGQLVHMDIKKQGRIPTGGGWHAHGRGNDAHKGHSGVGYMFLHHVVDDATRLAYSEILDDEKKETVTGFWLRAVNFFAEHGITIERVMTDNGPAYRSGLLNKVLQQQQIKHIYTRPYRPQTNGKVERFNRTLQTEWAYVRVYESEEERCRAYHWWLHDYNWHRPHSALGGASPAHTVYNLTGQYN